ncbi:MAG: Mpo1-like protein [Parvicellaceae bacterium]
MKKYKSFKAFYPYYLKEHERPQTKLLHFIGTFFSFVFLTLLFISLNPIYFVSALVSGYGAAWISHFFIEKNKPATFSYPLYSLMGDYKMFFETLLGKHKIF